TSVRSILQQQRQPVSLEQRVGPEQDTPLKDLLEDPHPTPEQELSRRQLHETIESLLLQLNSREGEVIRERFGLGSDVPRSLSEIGERLQLSRERVRQIETRALHKLRQPQNRCTLRDYLGALD
ncbi:MAG: sigma-70 family RNA polymerase sigma factor, partial [Cyanobacteria bacterium M_surface_7_m2_040]|nr:sigma-70 family RNA polymerase sigma factor [Cyanobacteria bacterium M_surface_7_m2_040]